MLTLPTTAHQNALWPLGPPLLYTVQPTEHSCRCWTAVSHCKEVLRRDEAGSYIFRVHQE